MKLDRSHVVGIVVGALATGLCAWGGWRLGDFDRQVCAQLGAIAGLVDVVGPVDHCVQQTVQTGGISDLDAFVYGVRGNKGQASAWVSTTYKDGVVVVNDVMLTTGGQEIVVQGKRPPTR